VETDFPPFYFNPKKYRKMKSNKNLGIWMDYSSANLIDPDESTNEVIHSKFSPTVKEEALKKGEKHMHTKEHQMHEMYFTELADEICKYDNVLLFGPTDAKLELHNYLTKKVDFKHIKVDIVSTDKMTQNQKEAFVKKHFDPGDGTFTRK